MLHIKDLTFGYTAKPLFQNLSFDVDKKQICHIVGNNGVGKSTLLALIAKLLTPTHGTVTFDITATTRYPIEYLSAEHNALLLAQNIHSNLEFWRRLSGLPADPSLLASILKSWQLSSNSLGDSLPVHKFSTGMKRRLALARLCYTERPIWLLDEPTFGLDRQAQDCLHDAIASHLNANGCVLLVTHQTNWLKNLPLKEVCL